MAKPIPRWALVALETNLPPEAGLMNVTRHSSRVVVANTHLGAVAVTRRPFRDPLLHLLPNPRERIGFTCTQCGQALEFREPSLPATLHCGWCGHSFALDRHGKVVTDSPASDDAPSRVVRRRCEAALQNGVRCRRTARPDSQLCGLHAHPGSPTAAALAARALSAAPTGPYDASKAARAIGAAVLMEAPQWANLDLLSHEPEHLKARLEHMTSTFVNAAAHELRTPMTPLLLSLRAIESESEHPEKQQAAARIAVRSAKRLEDVVERIVRVSLVQAGGLRVEVKPMDLVAVLRTSVANWQERAHTAGLRLRSQLPRDLPVTADAPAVAEIMNHLLSNAVRYGRPGGAVTVSAVRDAGGVRVRVTDSGVGIPSGDLERIFEPFVQLEAAAFQTEGGLGLGLFFARALALAQGAVLSASSAGADQGSCFELRFPARGRGA
ncbi:MAG: sensor histidine kinase [Thermoplasmatota archaeon]